VVTVSTIKTRRRRDHEVKIKCLFDQNKKWKRNDIILETILQQYAEVNIGKEFTTRAKNGCEALNFYDGRLNSPIIAIRFADASA
jgi:hypothetical protein